MRLVQTNIYQVLIGINEQNTLIPKVFKTSFVQWSVMARFDD